MFAVFFGIFAERPALAKTECRSCGRELPPRRIVGRVVAVRLPDGTVKEI
jgi:hypothetical protein